MSVISAIRRAVRRVAIGVVHRYNPNRMDPWMRLNRSFVPVGGREKFANRYDGRGVSCETPEVGDERLGEVNLMPYTAAAIANAFLSRSFRDKKPISPMKIQKLLYITHGYGLVECDQPILDEVFEAWKFGPVLSSLYHECKEFGKSDINRYLKDIDPETNARRSVSMPDNSQVNDIIDFVWQTYGDDSAISLSDWTHVKGGPWDQVTDGGTNILRHQDVPNKLIKEYFEANMYAA